MGVYIFIALRDLLLRFKIVRHEGRQNYLLGKLREGRNREEFVQYLQGKGFHNHFIALVDADEALGLRRLDGKKYQYHLRIFKDGEVRGHYELTPERHPFRHFDGVGMEARFEHFYEFLGDWVVPAGREGNTTSSSMPATSRGAPTSG